MIQQHIKAITEAETRAKEKETALLQELSEAEIALKAQLKQADEQAQNKLVEYQQKLAQEKEARLAEDAAQCDAEFAQKLGHLEALGVAHKTAALDFLWEEVTGRYGSSQNAAPSVDCGKAAN